MLTAACTEGDNQGGHGGLSACVPGYTHGEMADCGRKPKLNAVNIDILSSEI